jgi:hypothetical protein
MPVRTRAQRKRERESEPVDDSRDPKRFKSSSAVPGSAPEIWIYFGLSLGTMADTSALEPKFIWIPLDDTILGIVPPITT